MRAYSRSRSRVGDELVARPARGLQKKRIGGIVFELAAQPVDLHVDGALLRAAAAAPARQRLARNADPRRRAEQTQDLALALGQPDGHVAAPQFAAFGKKE